MLSQTYFNLIVLVLAYISSKYKFKQTHSYTHNNLNDYQRKSCRQNLRYTYRYLLPLEMECVHTIINIGCFSAFRENFSQAKQVETGMTFG